MEEAEGDRFKESYMLAEVRREFTGQVYVPANEYIYIYIYTSQRIHIQIMHCTGQRMHKILNATESGG